MSRWAKGLLVAAGLATAVWLLRPVGSVVQMVVLGALLAYLLDPLVGRLEARGMGRTGAAATVFFSALLGLGLPLTLLFPALAAQVRALREGIDMTAASEMVAEIDLWVGGWAEPLGLDAPDLRTWLADATGQHFGNIVAMVPGVLGLAVQVVVVPVIAFFLLRDGRRFRRGFIGLVPNRYFEFTLSALRRADAQLGGYLRGQLLAATIVGLLATLALWLIGVEYYFLIGLVAGVANMIPFLGPFIGGAVAVTVSTVTTGSFSFVVPIFLSFSAIQMIDNFISQPLLLAQNVELHPLAILVVLLVAGEAFGILGLLLAVPTAAVLKVLVHEFVTTFRSYRFS
ncbi:MAG: AI-2E family transporter [Bacteroidota bacterium]